MLDPLRRVVWLACLARLRAIGWLPWSIYGGWCAVAALQEPRLLRLHGVHLLQGASWGGASILLISMLFIERQSIRRWAWAANAGLTVAVAIVQSTVTLAWDAALGWPETNRHLLSAVYFLVAWMPTAVMVGQAGSGFFAASTIVLGSVESVYLLAGPSSASLSGMCLALAAAVAAGMRYRK